MEQQQRAHAKVNELRKQLEMTDDAHLANVFILLHDFSFLHIHKKVV